MAGDRVINSEQGKSALTGSRLRFMLLQNVAPLGQKGRLPMRRAKDMLEITRLAGQPKAVQISFNRAARLRCCLEA